MCAGHNKSARAFSRGPSMKFPTTTVILSLASMALAASSLAKNGPLAYVAAPRTDSNSQLAHKQFLEEAGRGGIDVYFEGDSITRRWRATDYPDFLANWRENFFGWNAADFGWGGDSTQNILWRLANGELDGVNPKVIVILAGTNNVGKAAADDARVSEITQGIKTIIDVCRQKAPSATIVLTAIFPRND